MHVDVEQEEEGVWEILIGIREEKKDPLNSLVFFFNLIFLTVNFNTATPAGSNVSCFLHFKGYFLLSPRVSCLG